MKRLAVMVLIASSVSVAAQPTGDTAKFQPAILNLQACIRANAPPAHIAGVRSFEEAVTWLRPKCYGAFAIELETLGAGDATAGGFRHAVRVEWAAFRAHLGQPFF